MLGVYLVHDKTDRHIGYAVKNTRNQHDHTDHCCRYAHDVGVEVRDQTAGQRKYDVARNIAHAVRDFLKYAGFYIGVLRGLHILLGYCHMILPFFLFVSIRLRRSALFSVVTVYAQIRFQNTEKPEYPS